MITFYRFIRVKVEHIIREDYLVEAMEMLELYCDLLLARFGLIETQQWVFEFSSKELKLIEFRTKTFLVFLIRHCDDGMIEAVTTLIWTAPRLQSDVQELKIVSMVCVIHAHVQFIFSEIF